MCKLDNKIIELAKDLELDIRSYDEECIAEICAKPTGRLFNVLNDVMDDDYYDGWCECLDLVKIEITKNDYAISISTWVNDCEINDCITIKTNGDFSIIERIMSNVEESI